MCISTRINEIDQEESDVIVSWRFAIFLLVSLNISFSSFYFSFSQLNERIKELELTRAKLEYQQKQLKQNLVIEKEKFTREERSRGQV